VTEIKLFDLNFKFCKNLSFEETLDFISQDHSESDPYVLMFLGLDDSSIINIRKQYDLHPILDSECSNSWLNDKDSLLQFNDYFLITINDADNSDSLETPVSLKMIVFKSHILIFAEDELFCINKVFNKLLKFSQFPSRRGSKRGQDQDNKKNITQPTIDIWNDKGCSKIESIFHKILEAIYRRLEKISIKECHNASKCMEDSSNFGIEGRVDFIINLTLSQKNLIYLEEVVRPKMKLFRDLINCNFFSEHFQFYLISLESRTMVLVHQIYNNKIIVKTAGKIFTKSIDNTLADSSAKLNDITKYFSSISTIFLPINLIAGLWGMNVQVPWFDVTNEGPFSGIVVTTLAVFITITVYCKSKSWM
jgi:Mg2+ and Co2+ transporter CorA